MTYVLLRAKHWQLFLLTTGAYFLTTPLVVYCQVHKIHPFIPIFAIVESVMLLNFLIPFLWMLSVIQKTDTPNRCLLRISALLVAALLLLVLSLPFIRFPVQYAFIPALAGFAAWLYLARCTAKGIQQSELQRPVPAGEYVGDLVLALFFPIGIWMLQPRVNQIANTLRK